MKNKIFLKFVLLVGDVVLMYVALMFTLSIRYGDFSFFPGPHSAVFVYNFSIIAVFWFLVLFIFDFYKIPPLRKVFDFLQNLFIFILFAGSFGLIYFYLKPQVIISPKTILILDVLIFSFLLCLWRYIFSYVLKFKNFKQKIIIFGFQPEFKEFDKDFFKHNNYDIIAFFNPDSVGNFNQNKIKEFSFYSDLAKYGIISDFSELNKIIEKEKIDLIVFTSNFYNNKNLTKEIFANLPIKLKYISFADFYENLTKKVPIEAIDEAWFLQNIFQTEKRIYELSKRSFDIIFSLLGLVITTIIFPFIAVAIKLNSSGPIFYVHKRVGKNGKVFDFYKFRTMIDNAEKDGPQWTIQNDERITKIGKILRATHIDEFPQFYNILKGDISFVGPRPERPEFVSQLETKISYYEIRHLINPGFTGWAQLYYPASFSVEQANEKFKYDLYYIKNRSFLLDLVIILKTIKIVF